MIVSGLDPQVRMNAYLNGQQAQMQLKKQQDALRIQQDAQQAEIRAQIQQAMLAHQKEQARALKDANERAEMGEVTAMEQQNMEARAQGLPPEQRRLQYMSGVLSNIPDGPARDAARKEFMRYEGELRTEQQKQAAMKMIEVGEKDGLAEPGEGQQRIAAGEEPETIAKEYANRKAELDAATIATTDSADALAKADAIYSTLDPESDIAKAVKARTVAFQNSKTANETPGEAKKFLKGIDDMVLADKARQKAEEDAKGPGFLERASQGIGQAARGVGYVAGRAAKRFGSGQPAPGTQLSRMPQFYGQQGPVASQPSAPVETEDEIRAVIAEMRKAGAPITPENIRAAKAKLRELNGQAAGAQ